MIKDFFIAKNKVDALNIFEYRKLYHNNVMMSVKDKKIDLWYDVPLYGKVDTKNYAIYISESNLSQLESNKGTFLVLDFVQDAFEDLKKYFEKAIQTKRIKNSGIIAKLEPQKAWTSASNLHHVHMDSLYKLFVLSYLKEISDEGKIQTIEDFLIEFLNFVEQIKTTFPITRTSFIKSRFCTPLVSGLMIEIQDKDRSDDLIKQKDILDDENFIFYKEAAKRFGFFIDKHIPWRLVADIMSPKMRNYMKNYGIDSVKLFTSYYYRALAYDMDILSNYMISMWNSYVSSFPYAKELKENCSGKKMLQKVIKREIYNLDYPKLNEEFWLNYYYKIRIKESNLLWDGVEINRKIAIAINLQKYVDKISACDNIEHECRR